MMKIDENKSCVEQLNGFYFFDKNITMDLKPQPMLHIDANIFPEKYCSYRHQVDSTANQKN